MSIITDDKTHLIETEAGHIKLTLKHDGITDYFTYNETLLEILKLERLRLFRDRGRLKGKLWQEEGELTFYLYDLACSVYHGWVAKDSWIDDLRRFRDAKALEGLTVDHADSILVNNTLFNLSLMKTSLNASKNDLTARVRLPFCLITAFVNGQYRVQLQNRSIDLTFEAPRFSAKGRSILCISFICDGPEAYVECLRSIVDMRIDCFPAIRTNGKWGNVDFPSFIQSVEHAISAQVFLANMIEDSFNPWKRISQ